MKPLCYLAGRVQPLDEARLDPLDRGNLFGDALYEAVKVLDGVVLHLQPHLDRLQAGLERVAIPAPGEIGAACHQLLEESGLDSGYLYLQVSRGVRSRILIPPPDLEPTVLIVPFEHAFDPPAGKPRRAVIVPDWRWDFRDIKTTSLIATVMGKLRARESNADEVLFVGPERQLREGGTTNVFVRRADTWETHPTDGSILRGVTRGTLLELLADEGSAVLEEAPRLSQIEDWQEAFLCGTTTGVQPLVEIDGQKIGGGRAGEGTRKLANLFDELERHQVAVAVAE